MIYGVLESLHIMAAFELTIHATVVVTARAIKHEWIARILDSPTRTEPDNTDPALLHALGRIEEHGNRVLRVIYNPTTKPPKVVTVYFDRVMKGKL